MLEIIRSGATLSFGMFNAQLTGTLLPSMSFTTGETPTDPGQLSSKYASNITLVEGQLKTVLEKYAALE